MVKLKAVPIVHVMVKLKAVLTVNIMVKLKIDLLWICADD